MFQKTFAMFFRCEATMRVENVKCNFDHIYRLSYLSPVAFSLIDVPQLLKKAWYISWSSQPFETATERSEGIMRSFCSDKSDSKSSMLKCLPCRLQFLGLILLPQCHWYWTVILTHIFCVELLTSVVDIFLQIWKAELSPFQKHISNVFENRNFSSFPWLTLFMNSWVENLSKCMERHLLLERLLGLCSTISYILCIYPSSPAD